MMPHADTTAPRIGRQAGAAHENGPRRSRSRSVGTPALNAQTLGVPDRVSGTAHSSSSGPIAQVGVGS